MAAKINFYGVGSKAKGFLTPFYKKIFLGNTNGGNARKIWLLISLCDAFVL
jgi:hypothetical protein